MENTKKLECEDCGYVATSERKLTKHYRKCPDNSSTSSSEDFVCSMCTYTADRKSDLSKHIKTKHTSIKTPTKHTNTSPRTESTPENNQKLQCAKCSYIAGRKSNLKQHCKKQHGSSSRDTSSTSHTPTPVKNVTNFKCTECDYVAGRKCDLTRHYQSKHTTSENPTEHAAPLSRIDTFTDDFNCSECDYTADRKSDLTLHNRKRHSATPVAASRHRCTRCEFTANRKNILTDHMRTHIGEKAHSCKTCGRKFIYRYSLKRHEVTHHGKGKFQCTLCEYSTSLKEKLQKHRATHKTKNTFNCVTCGKRFTLKRNLQRHKLLAHGKAEKFRCTECDYTASRKEHLNDHLVTHSGVKAYSCDTCGNTFAQKRYLKRHQLLHREIKEFHCTKCEFATTRKDSLKQHLVVHTQKKSLSCKRCGEKFIHKRSLARHKSTHGKSEIFKCTKCEYTAKQQTNLQRHLLTHSGEKPYSCGTCEKKLPRKDTLIRHELTHKEGKKFSCPRCDYATNFRFRLTQHLVTHTKGKAYSPQMEQKFAEKEGVNQPRFTHKSTKKFRCTVCFYATMRKSSLNSHFLTHTSVKAYKCGVCKKEFASFETLKQHKLTHLETKDLTCHVCSESFLTRGPLMSHLNTHLDNPEYQCVPGGAKIRQKVDIKHVKTRSNRPTFDCTSCLKRFNTTHALEKHLVVHSNKYNFKCKQCTYKSKRNGDLMRHRRTVHSERRKFTCGECQMSFKTKQILTQHTYVHSEEYRFKCSQCPYQSDRASRLKSHVLFIHSGRVLKCKYCNQTYIDERVYKRHLNSHLVDGTELIKCLKCKTICPSASSLKSHIKNKHFVCAMCHMIFNRKNALARHEKLHCSQGKRAKGKVSRNSQTENTSVRKQQENNLQPKTSKQNIYQPGNRRITRSASREKDMELAGRFSGHRQNIDKSINFNNHNDTFQDSASTLGSDIDMEREEVVDQSTPEPEQRRVQTEEVIQIMNRYIKARISEWTSEMSTASSQLKSPKERKADEDSVRRIGQYLLKLGIEPLDFDWVPSYGLIEIEDLLLKFIEEDEQALHLEQSRNKRRCDIDVDEQNNTMTFPKQDHIPRKRYCRDRKMQDLENGFTPDTENQVGKGNDDVAENEISEIKKRIANYLHQIGQLPINLDEVPLDRLKGMEALLLGYVREDAEERALQGEQRVQPNMHHNIENCEDVSDIDTANDEEVERLFLGVQLRESEIDDLLDEVHGKSSESKADVFIDQRNKQLKCDECERMFTSKNRLKIHKDFCSKILVLNCNMCTATYSRKEHLFAHVAKKHQNPNKAERNTTITETNSEDRVCETEEGAPSDPMTQPTKSTITTQLFSQNEPDNILNNESLDDIRERIKSLVHEVDYPDAAGIEAFIEGMSQTKLKTLEARIQEYGKQQKAEIADDIDDQFQAEETSVRLNKLKLVVVEEVEQSSTSCVDFESMFCQPSRDEGQTEQGHQETQSENTREIGQSSEDQQAEQPSGKSIENSPNQQDDLEKQTTEINECDDVNDKIEETECESGEEMMVAESGEVVFVLNQSQFKSPKQNEPPMTEPEQNENKGVGGAQVKSVVVEEVQQSSTSGDVEMMCCHSPRDEREINQCHQAKSINVREVDQTSEDQRTEEPSGEYSKILTIPNQKDDHEKDGVEINYIDNIDDKREEMEEEMMVDQSDDVGFVLNQSQPLHQNKTPKNGPQDEENTKHGVSPRSHVFVKDRFYRIFGGKSPHYDSDQETITEEINMQALDLSAAKNHTARAHGENGLDTWEADHAGTQNPGTDACKRDHSEAQTKGRNPQDCLVTQHVGPNIYEQDHFEAQSPRTVTHGHGRGPQGGSEDDSTEQSPQPRIKKEQPRRSTSTLPPGGLPAWAGIPRLEPTEDFTEDDWILLAKLEDLIPN